MNKYWKNVVEMSGNGLLILYSVVLLKVKI